MEAISPPHVLTIAAPLGRTPAGLGGLLEQLFVADDGTTYVIGEAGLLSSAP